MKKVMQALLVLAGTSATLSALAQTGRIAHFSHGGSAATLAATAEAADNFGNPPPYFVADSVRYLSAARVVQYGKWHWTSRKETTDTLRLPHQMPAAEAARYVQHTYNVRWGYGKKKQLLGFDSTAVAPARHLGKPAKAKRQRKAITGVLLPPPTAPGLTLLVLAGMAGAGGLLAGRKLARPQPKLT